MLSDQNREVPSLLEHHAGTAMAAGSDFVRSTTLDDVVAMVKLHFDTMCTMYQMSAVVWVDSVTVTIAMAEATAANETADVGGDVEAGGCPHGADCAF